MLLVFGPKRLKTIGLDLGNAIKGFRKAVSEDEPKENLANDAKIIEGEVERREGAQQKRD